MKGLNALSIDSVKRSKEDGVSDDATMKGQSQAALQTKFNDYLALHKAVSCFQKRQPNT